MLKWLAMVLHGNVYAVLCLRGRSTWEEKRVSSYGIGMNCDVAINVMNGAIADGADRKM